MKKPPDDENVDIENSFKAVKMTLKIRIGLCNHSLITCVP